MFAHVLALFFILRLLKRSNHYVLKSLNQSIKELRALIGVKCKIKCLFGAKSGALHLEVKCEVAYVTFQPRLPVGTELTFILLPDTDNQLKVM